ncbi:MAG TPA: undecaprenyl-diphosphatase UppP [Patescibacteria group bacterium]|nr:undecaprenyl-diphosphatase UppP [Patescibacteria group bacterium]
MEIFYSIIAGVIQGLTEFLPISSSGHLVVLHDFLQFDFIDNLAFDVILHLGTLMALLLFFWQDILKYFLAFWRSFFHWELNSNLEQRLAWYLILANIPAALVGFFWEDLIENVFRQTWIVALMLIIIGLILYLADYYLTGTRRFSQINIKDSLIIGLAQALALIPGASRSGITIIAGLSQKLNREAAARFSFLLSIPIIFAAGIKKVSDLLVERSNDLNYSILLLGFFASAIAGYFCIKYFLRFLQNHSLRIFAYYRIILGIVILIILFF